MIVSLLRISQILLFIFRQRQSSKVFLRYSFEYTLLQTNEENLIIGGGNMSETKQLNKDSQSFYEVNRKHKDSLFRLAFQEKKDLLELYNAINNKDYKDPEELIVYTLEDAVYIGIKNDISFLIGEMLSLYEHQSSQNPNMPMRGLIYLARNYESYIEQNNLDIYSSVLQKFPLPQYYVFYNGQKEEPDRKLLHLTDAFSKVEGKESCLNCTATLLNINYGKNAELMEKCKQLRDYSILVYRIRENQNEDRDLKSAVDKAIDDCIDDDVMREFLVKCRAEVRNMVLSYTLEDHEKKLKRIGGQEHLKALIQKKLIKGQNVEEIADAVEESVETVQKIIKELDIEL